MQRFSSIAITFWLLLGLAAWLGLGIFLVAQPSYAPAFKAMNSILVWDWLFTENHNLVVLGWFLGLCLVTGVSLVQLVASIRYQLIPKTRMTGTRRMLLLLVHIMFALVMLGHGVNLLIGFKDTGVELFPGQSVSLPDGTSVTALSVSFQDDPKLLSLPPKEAHRAMTQDKFHAKRNTVEIQLSDQEKILAVQKVWMLHPFSYEGLRIVPKRFVINNDQDKSIGIRVIVLKNTLVEPFVAIYALMIIIMLLYTAVTVRSEYR